ncbi:small multidrug export protein (QacE) [Staphylothermus marinus F1]|uniref:Small multidrug export protein (QacE) n=1 Tax=Staphylothermus marinus (strain ATCC 43588 / DSM 3639 / JCM 9404 / F1) TaxID=399550 RepID=A3DPE2_STAMF|nr:small multi-drug export protein [Staphylothermus marinus]ABN70502.1 small multidrug export protein (QacE) [Staphylothermus marinus F1]
MAMNDLINILFVILLAISPGIEARVAMPTAVLLGFDPFISFILSFVASSIPAVPLVYGLPWLEKTIIFRVGFLKNIYDKIIERARSRAHRISQYKIVYLGLALYVAVPFPLTGVWTGSLIAYILGLDRKKSTISIIFGNLIACTIIFSSIIAFTRII